MTENDQTILQGAACPLPLAHQESIVLGHGSGGKLTHELITMRFQSHFDNPVLNAGDDAAVINLGNGNRMAVSTDSHVVWPLFFPGGNIGRLAVCGTVNDLAMMGATPLYLTAGFILEEGLETDLIDRVVASMQAAALECGVQVVAGDTKVVERGKADRIYINTSGVGLIPTGVHIGGARAEPGDLVLISGTIGDHGIAVLEARGELGFVSNVSSDVAPLNRLVSAMMATDHPIHVLRDPTRGGLATSLVEIARQSQVRIKVEENSIPIRPEVSAACEMLGLDPLYIANEGKLIAILPRAGAEDVLAAMQSNQYGKDAAIIGEVQPGPPGRVLMKTGIGSTRLIDMLSGEMLPRIC